MSDKKISQLDASTTPLAGTEVLAVVQSGDTKKVSVANLTAGRAVSALSLTALASGTADAISLVQNSTGSSRMVQGGDGNTYILNDGAKNMILGTSGATKMTIYDATGDVGLQGGSLLIPSGKGIDFSADSSAAGMTSELLDDYEEGTWTPTKNTGAAFATATGRYTKIGNVVTATFIVVFPAETNANAAAIAGFPFSASGASSESNGLALGYNSSSTNVGGALTTTIMYFRKVGAGGGSPTNTDMSGATVTGAMVYTIL